MGCAEQGSVRKPCASPGCSSSNTAFLSSLHSKGIYFFLAPRRIPIPHSSLCTCVRLCQRPPLPVLPRAGFQRRYVSCGGEDYLCHRHK